MLNSPFRALARRALPLALGATMLVAPIIATPAHAQEQEFRNLLATSDPADPDITWVRGEVKPDVVTITMRRENAAAFPTFSMEALLSPASDLYDSRPSVLLTFTDAVDDLAAVRNEPDGSTTTLAESACRVRFEEDRIIITLDRAELGWEGPVHVGGNYRSSGKTRKVGSSLDANGKARGLGPVLPDAGAAVTRTELGLTASSMTRGQRTPVRATADVTAGVPGRVDFYDGTVKLANVPVKDAKASVVLPPTLMVGAHHLKAEFVPSDLSKYGKSSATRALSVLAARATSVRLVLSAAGMVQNQPAPVKATAVVSPSGAGRVDFYDGSNRVGAAAVTAGRATVNLPRNLRVGGHVLKAVFTPADQRYAVSQAAVRLAVRAPAQATTTTIRVSKKKQTYGKNRARIRVAVSGKPAGRIVIRDRGVKIRTLTLKRGAATYQLPKRLKRGLHRFRATFVPLNPAQHKTSTSRTVNLNIR